MLKESFSESPLGLRHGPVASPGLSCFVGTFAMDADLEQVLAKRRELSGDVIPTGDSRGGSSVEQTSAHEGLAFPQIQSLLIGANQSLEGRMPEAVKHFIRQIQSVIASCPAVVEALRKEGLNISDRIGDLQKGADSCASSSSNAASEPPRYLGDPGTPAKKTTAAACEK